jgi:hypothetical protein
MNVDRSWMLGSSIGTVHAGPTVRLGGAHVRDPCGLMRYSYGTHTFLFVRHTIKNYIFLIL